MKKEDMKVINVGLCKGRHEIPRVNGFYIFNDPVDPLNLKEIHDTVVDFFMDNIEIRRIYGVAINGTGHGDEEIFIGDSRINLYVTGLSQALAEVIAMCAANGVPLTLWHFNKDTGDYYPQIMF